MESSYLSNFVNSAIVAYGVTLVIVLPIICWAVQAASGPLYALFHVKHF